MKWESFTTKCVEAIVMGMEEAFSLGALRVGTEHLLLGLLKGESNLGAQLLLERGVTLPALKSNLTRFRCCSPDPAAQREFSRASKKVFDLAFSESMTLHQTSINTDHLFISMVKHPAGRAYKLIAGSEVDLDEVLRIIYQEYHYSLADDEEGAGALPPIEADPAGFDPATLLKSRQSPGEEEVWQVLLQDMSRGEGASREIIVMKGEEQGEEKISFYETMFKMPFVNLSTCPIDLGLALLLPEEVGRTYKALCIGREGGTFLVAMAQPGNARALEDMRSHLGGEIQPLVTPHTDLLKMLDFIYEEER